MKTTTTYFLALILFSLPTAFAQPAAAPDPHPQRGRHEGPLMFDYHSPGSGHMFGQYFKMPGRTVAPLMAAARPGGSYLGIHIVEINESRAAELNMDSPHGVEVSNVADDSPAAESGLEKGDVVVRFDGQNVRGVDHFVRLVRETPAGRSVAMSVLRNGTPRELTAKIGRRKTAQAHQFWFCEGDDGDCTGTFPDIFRKHVKGIRKQIFEMPRPRIVMQNRYLGAELEPVEGQLAEYFGVEEGVLVRSVELDTPGKRAGLRAGDVITSVDGKSIDSPSELREKIQQADPAKEVEMTVMRKGAATTLMLEPRDYDQPREERDIKARPVRGKRAKPL